MTDSNKPLVIYHSPCMDGFTAAWVCWLEHPDWEYYPAVHGDLPPDVTGRAVFMVDFSYKRPMLLELAHKAKYITILDHHKSAQSDLEAALPANVWTHFDMNKSGARLAWEYFNPGYVPPYMVQVVEDRDLGRFALPDTRELCSVIFSHDYSFEEWDELARDIQNPGSRARLLMEGAALERRHKRDVRQLVANLKQDMCIAGHVIPSANLPYTLSSDACHLMLEDGAPFAATWFDGPNGRTFSLRSKEDGLDVSEIAKQFGGGGHKHAAGFRLHPGCGL